MGLGSLIKGYTGVAKDLYEQNKPAVEQIKKNISTPTPKKKGETVAPRTPQKPTTVVPPKKEEATKVEPRSLPTPTQDKPVSTPAPTSIKTEQVNSKMTVWEKMDTIKNKWPTIAENIKNGTAIKTEQGLKDKQTKLLEDLKTSKNLDYIREDLSKIEFNSEKERKEFMEPFLRQPGLLESYIPKPKVNLFNTINDAKEYINLLNKGEFLTDTSEYLQGQAPDANKVLRSVVETILNDPTKKKEVKEYWMKEYEDKIKNPYGKEMEENMYNYLIEKTVHLSIPPENMTLEEKKEWVELRMPKQSIEKNIKRWKESVGFYGKPPTEAEIQEMQAKKDEAEQKEKEDFISKYIQGEEPIIAGQVLNMTLNPVQALASTFLKTKGDYETLTEQYPELAQKAEKEYYKEKEKAYLLSVAEAEMDKLTRENLGIRGVEKLEGVEAWNVVRLAKKLVQSGTLDIVKPDTLIGKAFKSTYVEDGYLKYNGFIIDEEFNTKVGQKNAQIADVGATIIGSLLPYSAISSKIKSTIQLAAKQKGTIGKFAKAAIEAQEKSPILWEITGINTLEEGADATIRKTTGQEYTFNDFLKGLSIGAVLGGGIESISKALKKPTKTVDELAEEVENEMKYRLTEDVLGDIEKILSYTKDIEDVKEVQVAPGVSLFNVFQEQKLAFENRKSQSMFGESRMVGLTGGKQGVPGVDYPADLPNKIEDNTPEYFGVENKDIFFEKDLPPIKDEDISLSDDGLNGKPFLVSEVDRDGWRYEPEKEDVDFVNTKRREINELNQTLDEINKDIENSTKVEETDELLKYRDSMIEYMKGVKDEIEIRKSYSKEEIEMVQSSIIKEEMANADYNFKATVLENGDEALGFLGKIIDLLESPGFKSAIGGEKNIGQIKSGRHKQEVAKAGKTWEDTVEQLFGDAYVTRDDFITMMETFESKFKSRKIVDKIQKLKKSMGGEIDDPQLWEEIIIPGINAYTKKIKKVPKKEQVETFFQNKKQRGVPRSLSKMKDTTKQTRKILKQDNMFYEQLRNETTRKKAVDAIKESEEMAFERAVKPENAEDVTIGMILVKKYQQEGRYDRVSSLLDRMAVEATKRGQMNQVLAMFSLLDPAGALRHAANIMRGMNTTSQGKKIAKKYEDVVGKLSKIIERRFGNTEIKFPQQDVKLEVREILRDAKMTEREINKIVNAIDKKFSNTEIKFPRQDIQLEVGNMLKEVSTEFAFLKKFELSDFEMRKIENRVKDLHKYPEGSYERMFQTKLLIRDMAELKPPSFLKKIGVYQTASMLLNIKTLARNIIGNATFIVQEEFAKVISSSLDAIRVDTLKLLGKDGERTLAYEFKDMVDSLKYAFGNITKNYREVINGVDFKFDEAYVTRKSLGLTTGRTLESKVGRKVEQALGISLRVPDRFFHDTVFMRELVSEARVDAMNKKIPKAERKKFIEDFLENPPEEALERAEARGLYATFQDDSVLSDLLVGLKRELNRHLDWGVGDLLLKFAKTPANLVNRQLAYSPIGLLNVLAPGGGGKIIKNLEPGWHKDLKGVMERHLKNYDVAEAELALSRALIGSTISLVSAKLAQVGILTMGSDDEKTNAVQKMTGAGYTQVNTSMLYRYIASGFGDVSPMDGDKMVSYDSILPVAYQISAGVAIHKELESTLLAGKKPEPLQLLGALLGRAFDAPNLIAEQPFFTGVSRFFLASRQGGGAMIGKGLKGLVEGVPATFVPTLLKQVRQYIDNVPNETYSPNPIQQMVNMTLDRIPILHDTKIPYIYDPHNKRTITGENAETYQNSTNSFFNVFMNTVFVTELNTDKDSIFNEYLALQKSTGETKFMPVKPEKNLEINDVKYKLNADDYEQYGATQGKVSAKLHKEIISSPFYNAMSDGEKVKSLYKAFENARDIAKGEFIYNSIKRGDMKIEDLTDAYRDKYTLYETLFQAGYGDADNKIYGNATVQTAILKYKNPALFEIARDSQNLGKEDLGVYMQQANLEVTKSGDASFPDWKKYKQITLMKGLKDVSSINNILSTIEARKSPDEKVISTMEKLYSEGKVDDKEKEYVYVSTLTEKSLKELGYLY